MVIETAINPRTGILRDPTRVVPRDALPTKKFFSTIIPQLDLPWEKDSDRVGIWEGVATIRGRQEGIKVANFTGTNSGVTNISIGHHEWTEIWVVRETRWTDGVEFTQAVKTTERTLLYPANSYRPLQHKAELPYHAGISQQIIFPDRLKANLARTSDFPWRTVTEVDRAKTGINRDHFVDLDDVLETLMNLRKIILSAEQGAYYLTFRDTQRTEDYPPIHSELLACRL